MVFKTIFIGSSPIIPEIKRIFKLFLFRLKRFISKIVWDKVILLIILGVNIFCLVKSFGLISISVTDFIFFFYKKKLFFKSIWLHYYIFMLIILFLLPILGILQTLFTKKKDYFCIYLESSYKIDPNDIFFKKFIKIIYLRYLSIFYYFIHTKTLINLKNNINNQANNDKKVNYKIIINFIKFFFIFVIIQLLDINFIFIRLLFLFFKNWLIDAKITSNWEFIFVNPNFMINKKIYYYDREWHVNPNPNFSLFRFSLNLYLRKLEFNNIDIFFLQEESKKMSELTNYNFYKNMDKNFFKLNSKSHDSEFKVLYNLWLSEGNNRYKNISEAEAYNVYNIVLKFHMSNKSIYNDIVLLENEDIFIKYNYLPIVSNNIGTKEPKLRYHYISESNAFDGYYVSQILKKKKINLMETSAYKAELFNYYNRTNITGNMLGNSKLTVGLVLEMEEIINKSNSINITNNMLGHSMYTLQNNPYFLNLFNKSIREETLFYNDLLLKNNEILLKELGVWAIIPPSNLNFINKIFRINQTMNIKGQIMNNPNIFNSDTNNNDISSNDS